MLSFWGPHVDYMETKLNWVLSLSQTFAIASLFHFVLCDYCPPHHRQRQHRQASDLLSVRCISYFSDPVIGYLTKDT